MSNFGRLVIGSCRLRPPLPNPWGRCWAPQIISETTKVAEHDVVVRIQLCHRCAWHPPCW
jgi:hypothetical protein